MQLDTQLDKATPLLISSIEQFLLPPSLLLAKFSRVSGRNGAPINFITGRGFIRWVDDWKLWDSTHWPVVVQRGIKSLTPVREASRGRKGVGGVAGARKQIGNRVIAESRDVCERRALAKSNLPDKSGHEINLHSTFFFFSLSLYS